MYIYPRSEAIPPPRHTFEREDRWTDPCIKRRIRSLVDWLRKGDPNVRSLEAQQRREPLKSKTSVLVDGLRLTSPFARRMPVQSMNANGSLWRSNNPLETARYTASVLFSRSNWSLAGSPPIPESSVSTMQFVNNS